MSILKKLVESTTVDANDIKDYSGVSFINESGVYELVVKRAWAIESKSGAIGIHLEFEGEGLLEQDIYMTNSNQQTFYNKNGKDMAMAGYVQMKKLNYILTGNFLTSLSQLHTEERVVKANEWKDVDGTKTKVEVEKTVDYLASWVGKEVIASIQMKEKEAQELKGDKYVGTGKRAEDKDGNPYLDLEILNFFNKETKQSASEMKSESEAKQLDKDIERLAKSPIRVLKTSNKPSATTSAPKAVTKPNIFG